MIKDDFIHQALELGFTLRLDRQKHLSAYLRHKSGYASVRITYIPAPEKSHYIVRINGGGQQWVEARDLDVQTLAKNVTIDGELFETAIRQKRLNAIKQDS